MKKNTLLLIGIAIVSISALLLLIDRDLPGAYSYKSKNNIHAELRILNKDTYEICYKDCSTGKYKIYKYEKFIIITFEAGPMLEFGRDSDAIYETGDKYMGNIYRFSIENWPFGPRIVSNGGGEDDYEFFEKKISLKRIF